MKKEDILNALHPLERTVLPILKDNITSQDIINATKLQDVEVTRALQWLENKRLITTSSTSHDLILLDKNGERYLEEKLPERRFLEVLDRPLQLDQIKAKANLDKDELSVALGILKKKQAITFGREVTITEQGKKLCSLTWPEEDFLKKLPQEIKQLNSQEQFILQEFQKRRQIIMTERKKVLIITLTPQGKEIIKEDVTKDLIERVTPSLLKQSTWQGKKFRHYDVEANVPSIHHGKRHFVNQAIDYARRIWLDLGFKEMAGSILNTSFWNFDALFTAQDHPVRELQDTFFIQDPEYGRLPSKELILAVKRVHEDGGTTKSKGWQYTWSPEEAKRNVLRTHTTVLSAQKLTTLKQSDLPTKFFSIGRCFRNETLDWSHLFEFNQTEGIVVDPNANFRHLLGYLKVFFKKMGFEHARFRPAYFPYTEPSVEIDAYHPIKKKWVELGGAGMFRPEVVVPLLGKDIPVLAWGPGFDRMIMDYYQLTDIRDLYKNDIKQLREMKLWLK